MSLPIMLGYFIPDNFPILHRLFIWFTVQHATLIGRRKVMMSIYNLFLMFVKKQASFIAHTHYFQKLTSYASCLYIASICSLISLKNTLSPLLGFSLHFFQCNYRCSAKYSKIIIIKFWNLSYRFVIMPAFPAF